MTDAMLLDEIRRTAGAVSVLAERCQDDIAAAVRLSDGRVLAPTTAPRDMTQFRAPSAHLGALLGGM